MSYSLNKLLEGGYIRGYKLLTKGSIIGVIAGDTGSLDYCSYDFGSEEFRRFLLTAHADARRQKLLPRAQRGPGEAKVMRPGTLLEGVKTSSLGAVERRCNTVVLEPNKEVNVHEYSN